MKLSPEQYDALTSAVLSRGKRTMSDIAREFGVSREYVRQLNTEKFELPTAHTLIRERVAAQRIARKLFTDNCLQRLKEKYATEYTAYCNAKQRCTNPKNAGFSAYGGRGIMFLFKDFREFMDDIKPMPWVGLTLDRKENNGNYEKGNVRWATSKQQNEPGHRRQKSKKVKC